MNSPYADIKSALSSFCSTNGFGFYAEFVTQNDNSSPSKYIKAMIISDNDTDWFDGKPRYRKYRVQLDIACPIASTASLKGWHDSVETALIGAGIRPIGNYRMLQDETSQETYLQKDYWVIKGSDERWG